MTTISKIFSTEMYKAIESRIEAALNAHEDFLTDLTVQSTRAVGDAIEKILFDEFPHILGDCCKEYSPSFARRAMADLAFKDRDDLYYVVDVSTHRTDTHFNMPNITSVERLARFYEDDSNYFVILTVKYKIVGLRAEISKVCFAPIEFFMWDCLTVGALGWGQIQIANSNYVNIRRYPRKRWMLQFCDVMLSFYPKEMEKIGTRLERFKGLRELWESKPDV